MKGFCQKGLRSKRPLHFGDIFRKELPYELIRTFLKRTRRCARMDTTDLKSDQGTDREVPTETAGTAVPIAEFAGRPDYPECLRGQLIDIGGYVGVVADIVHNSIKVRSPEGMVRSFNFHTLRKLYGPRLEPEPIIASRTLPEPPESPEPEEPITPKRQVIAEPNFDAPIQSIQAFTGRSDYPQCTLGAHIEIADYQGVVVEIVNRSLKVRSPAEITRSYNADALRKLYPPPKS
jgi:hypothetical protein